MDIVTLFCEIDDFCERIAPWLNRYLLPAPPTSLVILLSMTVTNIQRPMDGTGCAVALIGRIGNTEKIVNLLQQCS